MRDYGKLLYVLAEMIKQIRHPAETRVFCLLPSTPEDGSSERSHQVQCARDRQIMHNAKLDHFLLVVVMGITREGRVAATRCELESSKERKAGTRTFEIQNAELSVFVVSQKQFTSQMVKLRLRT